MADNAFKNLLSILGISLVLGACTQDRSGGVNNDLPNPVGNQSPLIEQSIGEPNQAFSVLGKETVEGKIKNKQLFAAGSAEASAWLAPLAVGGFEVSSVSVAPTELREDSLTLAYPKGLLGERYVFGGVITAVNDQESETLGGLKLSDLPPTHVRTVVLSGKANEFVFGLVGCTEKCTETSAEEVILQIPILAVDGAKDQILLDLAALGDKLNLIQTLDPDGAYTKLKTKTSKTISMDYSLSTLVFDVQVAMVPLVPAPIPSETIFTIRWYLRLASVFNPSFQPREATEGVGFFMTERSATPKIERHSIAVSGTASVNEPLIKYYVKNVPNEYKTAFQSAFDGWNTQFIALAGKKIIQYEFVDATDPKAALLVAGDVRYKIVEWDLVNRAGYGGLGPSIANQFTGEILSSNVLIQGPRIVKIYTEWFQASKQIEALRAEGRIAEAEQKLRAMVLAQNASEKDSLVGRLALDLGAGLDFKIHSQSPTLQDPIAQREDFELLPEGMSFDTYMTGYFYEMLAHELGHNLGLRHNFRGNLGAQAGEPVQGKVSVSVMEYLGRRFRNLDEIGNYDKMALGYGYLNVAPVIKDSFCTDEDVPDEKNLKFSAECSRDDATADPFKFLENRLGRVVDLIIGRGLASAPLWKITDMARELKPTVLGVGLYGATAVETGSKWSNFFTGGDRPSKVDAVQSYVVQKLREKLCPGDLQVVLNAKGSVEAQSATLNNLESLRQKAIELLTPLNILGGETLKCTTASTN